MSDVLVNREKAIEILSAQKEFKEGDNQEALAIAMNAIGRNEISQKDLGGIIGFAKTIGKRNFIGFIIGAHSVKFFGKESKLSRASKLLLSIKRFGPFLGEITTIPFFKEHGIVPLICRGEKPFVFRIEISFPGKAHFCDLNFDLKNFPRGSPAIVLGNFHGSNAQTLTELERKSKVKVFDLLLKEVIKSSTKHRFRAFASSTHKHFAYQKPSLLAVISRLKDRGEINEAETCDYCCSKSFLDRRLKLGQIQRDEYKMELKTVNPSWHNQAWVDKVDSLVENELNKIRLVGTVAHKIAFKKAGFRVKKKVHFSFPYWKLDPRRFPPVR
ncbi:MAG: hypothetical protein NTY48_01605 [Candidatus Diapherotrites archaeon]|nr:hypothetical protein [Candidatus Diapherotrites archaeon]